MERLTVLHPPAVGIKYTEEERETVYQLWRIAAGRNLTETSRRTGVPRETIGAWRDQHGWVERANREAAETVASLPEAIGALVATETVRSIETVIRIRDNEAASNKDRLTAAFWLAGIGGIGPVSKIETAVRPIDPTARKDESPTELANLSPDQLMALEADYRSRKRQS